MTTTTTIGQLVADLFAKYEYQLLDAKLAAFATGQKVHALRRAELRNRPRRTIVKV
jgi:hypothetical protein